MSIDMFEKLIFVICLPFYQKNNKKIPNEMVEFHPKNNIYIT